MRRFSRRKTLGLMIGSALLSACGDRRQPSEEPAPKAAPLSPLPDPTDQAVSFCESATSFGESLIDLLQQQGPSKTQVVSPLNLAATLAMLGQGARGRTAAEIAAVLRLDRAGSTLSAVGEAYASVRSRLVSTPNRVAPVPATVLMANGLWIDDALTLAPAFRATQAKAFDARIESADLSNPATARQINAFVERATKGLISSSVEPGDQLATLVNTLYFKGGWLLPFEKSETRTEPFTRADGSKIMTSLMRRNSFYRYFESSQLQAVALSYADFRYELVLVLPRKPGLPPKWATSALAGLGPDETNWELREGEVIVPRLNLRIRAGVIDPLRRMGLTETLSRSPDFPGIAAQPLTIGAIAHDVVFLMDEEGVEAAAVTEADTAAAATDPTPPPPPFTFRADRPFGFVLREIESKAPLLMGSVADPVSR